MPSRRIPLRLVPVRLVAGPADEAGAHRDVRLARADELEQPLQLSGRMLAVRVDAAAEGVAVLVRPAVARGDSRAEAAVLAEREHLGAVLARDLGRPVGGAVVDDEHVGLGHLVAELVEHGRKVLLLVPGGDEDEGVARCHAAEGSRRAW